MTFLIGSLAGFFGGLIGLGGGIIMIPLMVGILRLDQHQAHGTSLVALVFTGIAGALAYRLSSDDRPSGSSFRSLAPTFHNTSRRAVPCLQWFRRALSAHTRTENSGT